MLKALRELVLEFSTDPTLGPNYRPIFFSLNSDHRLAQAARAQMKDASELLSAEEDRKLQYIMAFLNTPEACQAIYRALMACGAIPAAAQLAAPAPRNSCAQTHAHVHALDFLADVAKFHSVTARSKTAENRALFMAAWDPELERQLYEKPLMHACVSALEQAQGDMTPDWPSDGWLVAFTRAVREVSQGGTVPVYPEGAGLINVLVDLLMTRGPEPAGDATASMPRCAACILPVSRVLFRLLRA